MSFVRTVLGDIDASQLGVCYAHEHVIIEESYATAHNPDFLINDVEKAAVELREVYLAGGRSMIDTMPADCGRSVLKLAEVSRRSGIHIVCPTGIHLTKYYPPGHWCCRLPAEDLTDLFIADIEEGIDANDYGGPTLKRTPHRAGLIKVAGGRDRLNDQEKKVFAAAARAQARTGCPILTHTEVGTAAMEQIEILRDNGADLRHVVLSHLDRRPELGYHRDVLQTGVRVEYDSGFRWKNETNHTLDLLLKLLPEFPDQIMLGMDAARWRYWRSYGGEPGLAFLLTDFVPKLREHTSLQLVDKALVRTPAATYSFRST